MATDLSAMLHFTKVDEVNSKFSNWSVLTLDSKLSGAMDEHKKNFVVLLVDDTNHAIVLVSPNAFPSQAYFLVTEALVRDELTIECHYAELSVLQLLSETQKEIQKDTVSEGDARLFNDLMNEAVKRRASDIFLNKTGFNSYECLFDIDTRTVPYRDYTSTETAGMMRYFYQAIADSHEDSMFSLDEAQFAAGEGTWLGNRVRLRFQSKKEFRYGNDFAIRTLFMSEAGGFNSYDDLQLPTSQAALLQMVSKRENGAVLLGGVTSSGKTTTVKVMLEALKARNPSLVIRTAEKPPEYLIRGARQYAVSQDYEEDIRHLMRMNPTILFIGEISDRSTAKLFLLSTETGHGVLTTIHTTNPYNILDRLESYGIDRSVMTQEGNINALIYQRRLPTTCKSCGIPATEATDEHRPVLRRFAMSGLPSDQIVIHNRKGCSECNNSGFKGGRVAMEVVMPDSSALMALRARDKAAFDKAWLKRCAESGYGDACETHLYHSLRLVSEGHVCPYVVEEKYSVLDKTYLRDNCRTWSDGRGFEIV